jgi:hypothetical protein
MYIQSDAYPFVFDECCKVHSRFRLEAAQDKELHAHLRDSAGAVSFATLKHQGAARSRLVKSIHRSVRCELWETSEKSAITKRLEPTISVCSD